MKRFLLVAALLLSPLVAAQPSTPDFVAEGGHVAQRFVAFSLRMEVAENDPRVVQAGDWLVRAAKATGEEDRAIAAACVRAARFFQDLTRVRANAMEPLEALATAAKPGQAMSDVLMAYVETRRRAAGKSHAEALAAMANRH